MSLSLIAIVGPTASGKTDLAMRLAQHARGAVVSADSRQVYAGLNIGTAKPREAWQEEPHSLLQSDAINGVDHYLLNIAPPTAVYSLASWQTAAFEAIDHLHTRDTFPYLVGGTMLYVDSVLDNYSLPQVVPDPVFREQLAQRPTEELYKDLVAQDPAAAQFVEAHHTRRIIRALEVLNATGKPFSDLRKKHPPRYRTLTLGLFPGWETLEENILARATAMLAGGLVNEVQRLRGRYGTGLPLLSTMNYREAGALLDHHLTEQQALAAMVRSNMRYAKRQMSWWKHRPTIAWHHPRERAALTQTVTEFLSAADQ